MYTYIYIFFYNFIKKLYIKNNKTLVDGGNFETILRVYNIIIFFLFF